MTIACTPTPTATLTSSLSESDPELDLAIQQARHSLHTFIEKIATSHADPTIVAVKARFYPPDDLPQDIGVDEVTYTNRILRGNMGDDIPSLQLELGEEITVRE